MGYLQRRSSGLLSFTRVPFREDYLWFPLLGSLLDFVQYALNETATFGVAFSLVASAQDEKPLHHMKEVYMAVKDTSLMLSIRITALSGPLWCLQACRFLPSPSLVLAERIFIPRLIRIPHRNAHV